MFKYQIHLVKKLLKYLEGGVSLENVFSVLNNKGRKYLFKHINIDMKKRFNVREKQTLH